MKEPYARASPPLDPLFRSSLPAPPANVAQSDSASQLESNLPVLMEHGLLRGHRGKGDGSAVLCSVVREVLHSFSLTFAHPSRQGPTEGFIAAH